MKVTEEKMKKQKFMEKQRFYYDKGFLGSRSGRPIRILSEYLSPLSSFNYSKIESTVVFLVPQELRIKKIL